MSARILVVEDEALVADDLQQALTALGYDVGEPVASGEEAIAAAHARSAELVLMDIRLQGQLDGVQAAARIKQDLGVPIVFLTSQSDDATIARAKEIGPHGYLVKPFRARELRTAVEIALERHALDVERRVVADQASRAARELSLRTLASGAAHEINNPLAVIAANAGLMREVFDDPGGDRALVESRDEVRDMLDELCRAAERIRRVVAALGQATRESSAPSGVHDVREVVKAVAARFEPSARTKTRIRVRLDAAPSVRGSREALEDALAALVDNAVRATNDARREAEVVVTTSTDERGDAIVEVADRGCGIPEEDLSRVFEPFFSTRGVGRGMGLGCFRAHSTVTAHGGTLTAKSRVGEGSTFRVVLPAKRV